MAGDVGKQGMHSAGSATGEAAAKGDPSIAKGMPMGKGSGLIDSPVSSIPK